MEAYYRVNKSKQYQLLLLLDGNVCDGGKYATLNDCKKQAKEYGAKELKKWEHPKKLK